MASQPTLEDIMSSAIKRDIAMRYFGFRKLIEEGELALSGVPAHNHYHRRIRLFPVRIIVGAEENKFDRLVRSILAFGAGNHGVVTFFPAYLAVEIDNDKIPFHGAGVEALPVALQCLFQ